LGDEGRTIGSLLFSFALPAALIGRSPFPELRNYALPWAPMYLMGELVPAVASMTVGWEGGWILGIAGAAAGAAAGAVAGWLFAQWTLPDIESRPPERGKATQLPILVAVVFALLGAYTWAIEWLTRDQAWAIGIFPIFFALLGAMVERPFLGLLSALPLVPVQLIPLVGSLTVGWEGGWVLGIAGAAAGAAAGAVTGWLFLRWIMPEYDKRRAREAARPREHG